MTFPTHAQFTDGLNSPFSLGEQGGTGLNLTLTFVSSLKASPASSLSTARESFSLLFEGPVEPMLEQKIYPFSHPVLGAFDLFIVPVGPDPTTRRFLYEAVFN
jgi:hypothetical protein